MSHKDSLINDKVYRGFRLHNCSHTNPNATTKITAYRVTLDNPAKHKVTFATEDDACKYIDNFLGDKSFDSFPELQSLVHIVKGIKPVPDVAKKLTFTSLDYLVVGKKFRRISL